MPSIPLSATVGLNCSNNPADVRAVKRRLNELGFNWLAADTVMGPETIKTIMLFQAIKNGFNRVSDPRNDGKINVNGDTHLWLQADNAPRWQKMPPGSRAEGFINDELADTNDNHDFGVSWLAETLRGAGAWFKGDWLAVHPNASVIRINDISLPRGGDTPMHATHEAGMCCDLKLPKLDGTAGGITVDDVRYDRETTRAMLEALWAQPLASKILLSDPLLVEEGLCVAAAGHHNHMHFEIKPPARILGARPPRPRR
jgi:hypothetical protein